MVQAQISPQWAVRAGSANNDAAYDLVTDLAGNSHVTGNYFNSVTFGNITLSSAGSADIFVARLSASGDWLDATSGAGTGDDISPCIGTDSSGNIYLAGYFEDTLSFGDIAITSFGSNDLFVAKVSPTALEIDLAAVEITGFSTLTRDEPYTFQVMVHNAGNAAQNPYQVQLLSPDNTVLAETTGLIIQSGETANIDVTWTPLLLGETTLRGRVVCDQDEYGYNNISNPLYVTIIDRGTISGCISNTNSNPLPGVEVSCVDSDHSYSTTTDAQGSYSFSVPEGTYTVSAFLDTYFPVSYEVVVESGQTVIRNFYLESTANDDSQAPAQLWGITNFSPNPIRDWAQIDFNLKDSGHVILSLYDLKGRHVIDLCNGVYPAGMNSLYWHGNGITGGSIASGVYFLRWQCGHQTEVRRIILIR